MEVMANQACMVFDFFFVHRLAFWDNHCTSQEREKDFGTFSVYVRLMVLELASLEKKKKKKEERKWRFSIFFKIRLLSFCTAELKSEDIIICTQEGQGFQWTFILLAKPTNHMPFHPCLLYCQNISTTLIPT